VTLKPIRSFLNECAVDVFTVITLNQLYRLREPVCPSLSEAVSGAVSVTEDDDAIEVFEKPIPVGLPIRDSRDTNRFVSELIENDAVQLPFGNADS
jgi:hypothetical protein